METNSMKQRRVDLNKFKELAKIPASYVSYDDEPMDFGIDMMNYDFDPSEVPDSELNAASQDEAAGNWLSRDPSSKINRSILNEMDSVKGPKDQ